MIKKALSIIFTCIALSTCALAQENGDDARSSKFYYFTKSGSLTLLIDSAYYTRIMTPDPEHKLFILEDVYYNSKTRLKGNSLTPGPYFRGQGDFKWYYPDGQLQETATYDNGKIVGKRMIYYANGKLQDSASYADGKLTGERTTYYKNGNKQFNGNYNNGVALS